MEATIKKTAKVKVKDSKPETAVRKSKFTEFWEKYPNGTTIVIDRKAVLK
jgi:hypothetical protein